MKFGLFLPGGHRGHIMSDAIDPPGEPTYEYHKRLVQHAEGLGFDFALNAVKFRGLGGRTKYWHDFPDSFVLTAGLAEATERMHLYASFATLVQPPPLTAKMATTLAELSNGRCGINLVTGWYKREYEMMGLWPGDSHFRNRYDHATEYVTIMRQLWETGRSDFHGTYFQMDDCEHSPIPQHDIPIICAGGSPRGLGFTANMADIAFIGPSSWDELDSQLETLEAKQQEAGRRVTPYVAGFAIIGDTDDEAEGLVDRIRMGTDHEAVRTAISQASADPNPAPASTAQRIGQQAEDDPTSNLAFLNSLILSGSPATVAAQVDRIARAQSGETRPEGFVISFTNYMDQGERFMKEVVPLMKDAGSVASAA